MGKRITYTRRPTHTVVGPEGAVSQHLSLELAESAAARRGPGYSVRARRSALPPVPAAVASPGARPRAGAVADLVVRVRVTRAERDRLGDLARRDGVSVSEYVRRRALG